MTLIHSSTLLFIGVTLPLVRATEQCTNNDEKKCESRITVAVGVAIGLSSLVVILLLVSAVYIIRRRRHAEEGNSITFEIEPSQIAGPPDTMSIPAPARPATTYNPAYDPAVPGKTERIRANLAAKVSKTKPRSPGLSASKTLYPFVGYSSKNPPPLTPEGKF